MGVNQAEARTKWMRAHNPVSTRLVGYAGYERMLLGRREITESSVPAEHAGEKKTAKVRFAQTQRDVACPGHAYAWPRVVCLTH